MFGLGVTQKVRAEVRLLGARSVLLVSDGVGKAQLIDAIEEVLRQEKCK